MARVASAAAAKRHAEAGEPSEAGIGGAAPPTPDSDRSTGRRAAWRKECHAVAHSGGEGWATSDGHGKRVRASTGSSITLCRSASPDPSAEWVARATFTAGLRCSMALRSKVSPQGARARFAGARASRLHGSGPSSLWLRAIRLTGAQGRARAVRAPNRGSGHLAAAGTSFPQAG